jgi:hypothetical protein
MQEGVEFILALLLTPVFFALLLKGGEDRERWKR